VTLDASTLKLVLVIVGWLCEVTGILLVATAELHAPLRRILREVAGMIEPFGELPRWLARHLHVRSRAPARPPATTDMGAGTVGGIDVSYVSEGANDRQQLDHVLAVTEELQHRLGEVEERLRAIESEWTRDITRVQEEIEAWTGRAIGRSHSRHITARRFGVGLLVIGSILLAISAVIR
jgi:hypothetical protein